MRGDEVTDRLQANRQELEALYGKRVVDHGFVERVATIAYAALNVCPPIAEELIAAIGARNLKLEEFE
jgi:hypothetical protein